MPPRLSPRSLPGMRWVTALLFVFLAAVPAWARSFYIDKFDATIHVDNVDAAPTTEKITFVFSGPYQGIYRSIPVEYPGANGSNYSLFLKVDRVTDEAGTPLKYKKTRNGPYLKLQLFIPDATDSTRTVIIEYSAPNATKFFEDHDEFYWNVTGNDWTVPIHEASANVFFPPETSGALKAQAFSGPYGSTDPARA